MNFCFQAEKISKKSKNLHDEVTELRPLRQIYKIPFRKRSTMTVDLDSVCFAASNKKKLLDKLFVKLKPRKRKRPETFISDKDNATLSFFRISIFSSLMNF